MSTVNTHQPTLAQASELQDWSLVALTPELGDITVTIGKSLSIGRSDSNDLVLASPQISRQHAKINRIGDNLYLQDLGSANGTFVNGERISTEAIGLQPNDELALADLLFVVSDQTNTTQAIKTPLEPTLADSSPISILSAPTSEVTTETVSKELPITVPTTTNETSHDTTVTTYQISQDNQSAITKSPHTQTAVLHATSTLSPSEAVTTPQPNNTAIQDIDKTQPSTIATTQPLSTPPTHKKGLLMVILIAIILLIITGIALLSH